MVSLMLAWLMSMIFMFVTYYGGAPPSVWMGFCGLATICGVGMTILREVRRG